MIRDKNLRSLRVLQVLEPSGGGSGRHFIDLCGGLKQRGHVVHAIYSPVRAEQRFVDELLALGLDGAHCVEMARAPGPGDIASLAILRRLARRHGPFDVIHGHSSKAGALARIRFPGEPAARVYTPHAFRTMDPHLSRAGHMVYGTIERLLARYFTDRLICVSADEYAHARALGMRREKLEIVVNGVVTPPSGLRQQIRSNLGMSDNDFVYGFVGRLSKQKAPERLVRAFALVAERMPSAHLLMVGTGEDEGHILSLAAKMLPADRFHFTSQYTGAEVMDAIDVLTMPSRYEAMSYVMLEAAAAAKPMVLTEVGGVSMVLKDGQNGILVANTDDARQLAHAMLRIADPVRLARYAEGALARKDDYSLSRMVTDTEAIYRSVLR
ncbi:glycosyltransferase family 4 protein [Sinorhizobium sp. BG8]|uniref:glycosyltransferase family 4 protein n=1 Tax=Sinorhizobium sp. BG8 TaxID=2613773 RepID=UPI00193CFA1A|nr:glycosyltransferase family 4 protein [Sinorhizobium sp. BG8]QRM56875.1 glycosyltransferase family 4 protein [Sinorhizobium sp. BG8]